MEITWGLYVGVKCTGVRAGKKAVGQNVLTDEFF
jgi:hypothetical protein